MPFCPLMMTDDDNSILVVHQLYQTDVNVEHVIRGNSALMRCTVPSFVADYATVDAWLIDSHLVTHNSNDLGT